MKMFEISDVNLILEIEKKKEYLVQAANSSIEQLLLEWK